MKDKRFLIKPATASEMFKKLKRGKKKQEETKNKLIELGILKKE